MGKAVGKESFKVVPAGRKKCVWMEAGVVSFKLCDNNFDCPTCSYDHGMQDTIAAQKGKMSHELIAQQQPDQLPATWRERMLTLPSSQRRCRYTMSGHVANKLCPNSYECGNCSYDQTMQERFEKIAVTPEKVSDIAGIKLVDGYYYHEGHTWTKTEVAGRVRVGVDDFARKLLGVPDAIRLPELGEEVHQGKKSFTVFRNGESVGGLSPIDGVVSYVNYELLDNPSLLRESNYENGWLFIVETLGLKKNLKKLMSLENARQFMKEEKDLLVEEAGNELRLAADGALVADDIAGELEGESWTRIARKFLRS